MKETIAWAYFPDVKQARDFMFAGRKPIPRTWPTRREAVRDLSSTSSDGRVHRPPPRCFRKVKLVPV